MTQTYFFIILFLFTSDFADVVSMIAQTMPYLVKKNYFPAIFVFLKVYIKRIHSEKSFCQCLEPNLEQDSFCMFTKSMEILSKSDTLTSISQSVWTLNKFKISSWTPLGLKVMPSQKYSKVCLAHFFLTVTQPELDSLTNTYSLIYAFVCGQIKEGISGQDMLQGCVYGPVHPSIGNSGKYLLF